MKKSKKRSAFDKPIMPPTNDLVSVEDTINRINKKLEEQKDGNYRIVIKEIKPFRRIWITYEYYADVFMHIIDIHNPKRETGVIVPGMGNKPIELNKRKQLNTNSFVDWFPFEDQLFERAGRWQTTINEEGHYEQSNPNQERKEARKQRSSFS